MACKSVSTLLVLILVFGTDLVVMKNTFCRNKYKEDDFIYCTKFGLSDIGMAQVTYRAKFLATYKKSEDTLGIKIGVYSDFEWD